MGTRLSSHHLGTYGWLRLLATTTLFLVLVLTLEASPAAGASAKACRVRNTDSGRSYTRLQQAVKAARPGARIIVRGTCKGGTFINKDLVIVGKKTKPTGKAVLDGKDKARVLTIKPKVKVNIRSLVIRNGRATRIPNGGGISNRGKLTLRDVIVTDNYAQARGGGIYNEGVARIGGKSRVRRNGLWPNITDAQQGGGIYNSGRLILEGSARIRTNHHTGMHNIGTLVMDARSSIVANGYGMRYGGGSVNAGTWTMNDASSVRRDFGGVSNTGSLTMNDSSSLRFNWGRGGAFNSGSLTLNDLSSIHHNRSGYYFFAGGGAGVFNDGGTLTMTGSSSIHDNRAFEGSGGPARGGGVYSYHGGILTGVNCAPHTYANVYGNTPDDCYFE